ncbi:MAG: type II/IV secretion system protein [Sulfurimonas sp.]|jgi:Tfp pilus assembly protein FimT
MKRFAFTMLELVFVIIVIGILAVLAMPNFNRHPLQEAAEQVASHIRYTQHLAMVDDKFDPTDVTWYKEKWQIRFRRNSGSSAYVIFSDSDADGNSNNTEMAIDPLTGKRIDGISLFTPSEKYKNANLTEMYDIQGDDDGINQSCFIADGSSVTSNRGVFAFDNLGRPYRGVSNATSPTTHLMTSDCNLTLTNNSGESIIVRVSAETGYVCILDSITGQCQGAN